MPALKKNTTLPSHEEDIQLTSAALSDVDSLPYTDREWDEIKQTVRVGRPKAQITKERISIRLSPEVLEKFRSTGSGWQTRIDAALKEYISSH